MGMLSNLAKQGELESLLFFVEKVRSIETAPVALETIIREIKTRIEIIKHD